MSNQAIMAAKAARADLINREAKFQEKAQSCNSHAKEISARIAALELAHTLLERRYVCDEATLAAVTTSRQELEAERASLVEIERLSRLAEDAIQDINKELQKAAAAVKESQSQYCLSLRDQIFSEIKSDKKLKEKLLQAMAATAANGLTQYTTNPQSFVNQHISRILPVIAPDEISAGIADFKSKHGLSD